LLAETLKEKLKELTNENEKYKGGEKVSMKQKVEGSCTSISHIVLLFL
jgi:hypothetical protein